MAFTTVSRTPSKQPSRRQAIATAPDALEATSLKNVYTLNGHCPNQANRCDWWRFAEGVRNERLTMPHATRLRQFGVDLTASCDGQGRSSGAVYSRLNFWKQDIMRRIRPVAFIGMLGMIGILAGCAAPKRDLATAAAARMTDPVTLQGATPDATGSGYQIGATDLLNISVFQVPDLSFEKVRVDVSGSVQLPLIGSVQAAGRTPDQLAQEIQNRLADRFLQDPQVTITVDEAASQKVTVDGAVSKPGVYHMRGQTSLLQAVAMAEGPTEVADLRSVAVFRTTPSGRMVAVFDLAAIRNAEAPDPMLLGDDIVVVDTSRLSAATQRAIQIMPGLAAVFRYW